MQLFTKSLRFRAPAGPALSLITALGIAWTLPAGAADPSEPLTAALPPAGSPAAAAQSLPRPLEQTDAGRYESIFRLQANGNWGAADALIGRLTDPRLLGHVLAQRYLHPDYRTSYPELRDWLAKYDDHPQAARLHRLAMLRKPEGEPAPEAPDVVVQRIGNPDRGNKPEGLNWVAGLANWRVGAMKEAARQFEIVANDPQASDAARAAGAYWAARSYLKSGQPGKVTRWLKAAAAHPRTFYGLLARRALGIGSGLDWKAAPKGRPSLTALAETRGGSRALALLQVGRIDPAEDELYLLLRRNKDAELAPAILAVAQQAGLPSVSVRMAVHFENKFGTLLDTALYPVPAWRPDGGFTVDPALLFALMRQESAFNPRAESPMGAAGLMQLMPSTAQTLTEEFDLVGADKKKLFDPVLNLTLAQRYVAMLLRDPNVKGDLLMLAIAYNAGPGNLAKWRKWLLAGDADPLLFIESIPGRETRQFVERVMANYWIYQERLGQPTPSLDALASGAWPVYTPAESVQQATIANAGN